MLLLISLALAVIINFIHGKFSWPLIKIAALNSIALGASVLLNIFICSILVSKIRLFFLYAVSIVLMSAICISGFIYILILEPFFLLYGADRLWSYFLINFLFALSLIIISNGFLIYQDAFERKNRVLFQERLLRRQMEEQLYHSKINPHFLFNSLNLLVTLLPDTQKAEEALITLSELLRFHLSQFDHSLISLSLELENVEKYIYLQKLRFQKRLNYQFTGTMQGDIPPLIIQPLVENSIKHNIRNVESLRIDIETSLSDEKLVLVVRDSCLCLQDGMIGKGSGLSVTRKRIELAGGEMKILNGYIILIIPQSLNKEIGTEI